jgi:hypothetical protein
MIAELSGAETVRSQTMLLRPSKLLARMNWLGTHYELLVPDVGSLTALFDQYPIDVIVLATDHGVALTPHDRVLREMLASDPRWVLERRYTEPGTEWAVYRRPLPAGTGMEPLIRFVRSHMRQIP